jgi:hypothetical protein
MLKVGGLSYPILLFMCSTGFHTAIILRPEFLEGQCHQHELYLQSVTALLSWDTFNEETLHMTLRRMVDNLPLSLEESTINMMKSI